MSKKTSGAEDLKLDEDYTIDEFGRWVFTAAYLLKRGYCCKSGCRNCPYGFERDSATPPRKK